MQGCHGISGGITEGLSLAIMEVAKANQAYDTTIALGEGAGFSIRSRATIQWGGAEARVANESFPQRLVLDGQGSLNRMGVPSAIHEGITNLPGGRSSVINSFMSRLSTETFSDRRSSSAPSRGCLNPPWVSSPGPGTFIQ